MGKHREKVEENKKKKQLKPKGKNIINKDLLQIEGNFEMKKLGNQTGTSEVSLTNRIQVTENKILHTEDTIKEIVISVKKIKSQTWHKTFKKYGKP